MAPVRATYRLQLSSALDLHAAADLTDYLDSLGISHLYSSPFLAARKGSPHGYDITDHNRINPELGGFEAFERLHQELRRRGMGCILDFVPNHMGIGRADNPWWLDVLEWGRSSPYADYFDIDWEPAKAELRGKVLLPFLGASYGEELESGKLRLEADLIQGSLWVQYHEHRFPIGPRHYERVMGPALARTSEGEVRAGMETLRAGFHGLPRGDVPPVRRAAVRARAAELKREFAELAARHSLAASAIEDAIGEINGRPGHPRTFVALHRLLEAQAYRLSFWRVAADEINYRRFFDINELAALRVERQELFDTMHRLVFRLIDEGKLDGLRIDHIDGLFDPRQYCERLASRLLQNREDGRVYLVVEKILAPHERFPHDWPVDGTTGYDFANQVLGLFVDAAGRHAINALYRRFTAREANFAEVLHDSKKHVLRHLLASELQVLANGLERIAEQSWRTRDFTLNTLREALAEVVACFPVYRTYIAPGVANARDRAHIDWAVREARRRSAAPGQVFDFINNVLAAEFGRGSGRRSLRRRVVDFAMKAQQLTSPVAAKGEEDTAFYRHTRFVALNEVGSDPDGFGTSLAAFHRINEERAADWPRSMLATSTHDSKRGEDVRARLAVLSELPDEWRRCVLIWARINRKARTRLDDGPAPARNDEYLFYQTLVGSWPLELLNVETMNPGLLDGYRERVRLYMTKAVREAKLHSSWGAPNESYEGAVSAFVDRVLDMQFGRRFFVDFVPFQGRIAFLGMANGLAQTLLKHTVPGVPDTYQGCELWDFNLVDPDNRRPVDFERRMSFLREVRDRFADPFNASNAAGVRDLLDHWPDGRIKLYLTWRILELRRARPKLFDGAGYVALEASGPKAGNICAFARIPHDGGTPLVLVVPRLIAGVADAAGGALTGHDAWSDTIVTCPDLLPAGEMRNILTGAAVYATNTPDGRVLSVAEILRDLPVAALVAVEA